MKILITGAAGFIGGHLYSKLKSEGHDVIGIDNFSHPSKNPINGKVIEGTTVNTSPFINLDIRSSELQNCRYVNRDWVKQSVDGLIQWSDVVYHLAAQIHVDKSIENPRETIDTNVYGTLNIIEACRKYRKKLIFASSSEVYGSSQTDFMAETHPLDAQSPYAASKVAGDRLCKSYIDTYGLDICILRNFNTFGPYQSDGGEGSSYGAVIGIFTRAALRNEPIRIFGSGEQRRDYIYVTDALKGYEIAQNYTGVLNIGSGKTISINELAEKIKRLTNSQSEIVHVDPRPGEVQRLCADITKARSLGFEPETNFDNDLNKYIEWYKTSVQ